jgi:hypothetical protein
MLNDTNYISTQRSLNIAPKISSPTQTQICHPPYTRYDHRAYPVLPAKIIVIITILLIGIFIINMYLSAYLARRRVLHRIRFGGPEADFWERFRRECVKVRLARPREEEGRWFG